MDISFTDPDEIPLPSEEVRILDLELEPYPDGKRVRLFVELSPFQKSPSGDLLITNQVGEIVSATSFIEAVTSKFDLTLHLRMAQPGEFTARMTLFYPGEVEEDSQMCEGFLRPEKKIVDVVEKSFMIEEWS